MSTLHEKILNEFLNSNIIIKSMDRLNEYISYCINNNQNNTIKGKTSHHHILPKADSCFPQFKNLKVNKWNGTYINHNKHIKAHVLLSKAIKNSGQSLAVILMTKKYKENTSKEYNNIYSSYFRTITKKK